MAYDRTFWLQCALGRRDRPTTYAIGCSTLASRLPVPRVSLQLASQHALVAEFQIPGPAVLGSTSSSFDRGPRPSIQGRVRTHQRDVSCELCDWRGGRCGPRSDSWGNRRTRSLYRCGGRPHLWPAPYRASVQGQGDAPRPIYRLELSLTSIGRPCLASDCRPASDSDGGLTRCRLRHIGYTLERTSHKGGCGHASRTRCVRVMGPDGLRGCPLGAS